jgi:putative DNA primase/helicase
MTLATHDNIRAALAHISPDLPREEWAKVGMAIKDGLNGDGLDVFDEWSKGGQSYNETDTRDTWRSLKAGGGVTVGTLFFLAGQHGWKPDGDAPQETEAERQARERKRKARLEKEEKTTAQKRADAELKAAVLLGSSAPAQATHPYLIRKGIAPVETLREIEAERAKSILGYAPKSDGEPLAGRLLLARVEIDGTTSTVEMIDEAGRKSAIAGGAKAAGYWPAQTMPTGDGAGLTIAVGEGVATVLSAKEATGHLAIAALTSGNLLKAAKAMQARYPKAALLVLADIGNGQAKAEEAARACGATLAAPNFAGLNATGEDTDFNDLHRLAGPDAVKAQIAAASAPAKAKPGKKIDFDTPVYDFPHTTESGRKRATIANLRHMFKSYGIEVAYDELLKKQAIRLNNANDRGHGDLIDNAGVAHIRSLMALNGMPASALDLLPALFAEKATNPVLDWIESKAWDKKDRLRTLADTLTVADNDQHYRDVALFTWLVQCVAAADGAKRTPNKDALPKYELAFILQGGQGVKKTSWFKRLVPKQLGAYIVDGAHLDPADKETVRTCISSWICELGELDSTFRRADISRLKAFLSKQNDTLRLPYDRAESQFGRRTSFCGSVNPEQFLGDSTGSRRFLPLQVTACNSLHQIDMQQAWAQVWKLYQDGRQWWCNAELEEMLKERHERHSETTPVEELIAEAFHLDEPEKSFDHTHFTATRILMESGIKEPKAQQASILNSYLRKLGFKQVQNEGVRGYWIKRRRFQP